MDNKDSIWYSVVEKAMAPHSGALTWKIPRMEEPGGLQSMGSLRVEHDWSTSLSLFTFLHWRRKWQPTPVFLPGESQGRGAWWAAVYGVAQSWTRLKWLSIVTKDTYFMIHLHYVPQVVKLIETENRIVVARVWGERGNEGLMLMGSEFLLWRMKIYWRWMLVTISQQHVCT